MRLKVRAIKLWDHTHNEPHYRATVGVPWRMGHLLKRKFNSTLGAEWYGMHVALRYERLLNEANRDN